MNRTLRFPVLLALIFFGALLFYLWGAAQMPVTDPVESNYAETAKEMALSGDWLTPQIFGNAWFDKPIFTYWMLAASYLLFGATTLASRFPAAVAGAATIVLTILYVKRITGDRSVGVWTGLLLATSLEFWILSHAVVTDSFLLLFTVPTLFSAYIGITERKWGHMAIAYAAAGAACLVKGPVGLLLPGLILFLWVLTRKNIKDFLYLFAPHGILLFALVALPWYYWMYTAHGEAFVDGFLGLHNMTRALVSEHPEYDHFYYYLGILPASLLPWTGLSLYAMWRGWKERTTLYDFLMLWCWGTVAFYTLVATKYVTYTYIAVVPCILLAVLAFRQLFDEETKGARIAFVVPYILTLLALAVAAYTQPGNYLTFYVICAYTVVILYSQWKKKQYTSMPLLATAAMAVSYTCLVFGGLTNFMVYRSTTDMAQYFHDQPGRHYIYNDYNVSYVFYMGDFAPRVVEDGGRIGPVRDDEWEKKYSYLPTITISKMWAEKDGPIVLFVPRSAQEYFEDSASFSRFVEDKAFTSGRVYKEK